MPKRKHYCMVLLFMIIPLFYVVFLSASTLNINEIVDLYKDASFNNSISCSGKSVLTYYWDPEYLKDLYKNKPENERLKINNSKTGKWIRNGEKFKIDIESTSLINPTDIVMETKRTLSFQSDIVQEYTDRSSTIHIRNLSKYYDGELSILDPREYKYKVNFYGSRGEPLDSLIKSLYEKKLVDNSESSSAERFQDGTVEYYTPELEKDVHIENKLNCVITYNIPFNMPKNYSLIKIYLDGDIGFIPIKTEIFSSNNKKVMKMEECIYEYDLIDNSEIILKSFKAIRYENGEKIFGSYIIKFLNQTNDIQISNEQFDLTKHQYLNDITVFDERQRDRVENYKLLKSE
jgi:hypothetical protein